MSFSYREVRPNEKGAIKMSAAPEIRIRAEVDQQDANVCRFVIDRPVHEGSPAAFTSRDEAKDNKLALNLFAIPGVAKVEVNDNQVTVTKTGFDDWRQVGKRIGGAIRLYLNPPPPIS